MRDEAEFTLDQVQAERNDEMNQNVFISGGKVCAGKCRIYLQMKNA